MTIRAILLFIATCTIARVTLTAARNVTDEDDVCSSTECLNIASELSKTIDPTIDPCEDFYEFACGSFLKSTPINVNQKYTEILEAEIYADIKQLIEADIEPNEPKPFKLVKTLYKSCMNTSAIEAKGLEPLQQYLRDFGGWPVVEGDSWNGENFDWRRTIYKFRHAGDNHEYYIGDTVGYLVHFVLERDGRDPAKLIPALKFPLGILLPSPEAKDFYKNELFRYIYYDSMMSMAWMLGADEDRAMVEIYEILSFETKLTEMKLRTLELIKLTEYNPMTIAELNEQYPGVPWMTYIQKFLPPNIRINDKHIVNVPNPNYYVELEALMANTPKRVQANYVMSRIALRNAIVSTEPMRKLVYRILGRRPGSPRKQDRTSYCAVEVIDHLWQSVIVMYADKFLVKETKDVANAIVANLEWQLNVKLIAYKWTSEAAWKSIPGKIAGLATHVAYPDSVLDHSKLEYLYGNLEFTEDDYFGNMDRLSYYDHALGIKEFEEPLPEVVMWEYFRKPIGMKSDFDIGKNTIRIAAGHLRGRFFGKDRPKFMNYGALGTVIGHEMVHAIFEDGFYRERCGKDAEHCGLAQRPEFANRAQCLIDQYESYKVDNNGTKLNARQTLTENLADVGGMRLAYDAYEGWAAIRPEEPKLRGLEQYTAKQMFWISTAVTHCEKAQPERILRMIPSSTHTISKFRVIGKIANMPEFAEDFNCKATSMMNLAKRCDIWEGY